MFFQKHLFSLCSVPRALSESLHIRGMAWEGPGLGFFVADSQDTEAQLRKGRHAHMHGDTGGQKIMTASASDVI